MNISKLVSIIIPVYKPVAYLKEAIDSALGQTHKNCEIIVVNDGSPEDVDRIIAGYGNEIKYIKKNMNNGLPRARNTGISSAKGEYIAFLDADDIFTASKIEKQLEVIDEDSRFVFCGKLIFDDEGNEKTITYSDIDIENTTKELFYRFFPSPSTVLVEKELLMRSNLFDPDDEMTDGDYDLWIRCSIRTNFKVINESLVKIRRHSQSIMMSSSKNVRAMGKIKPLIKSKDIFLKTLALSETEYLEHIINKFDEAIQQCETLSEKQLLIKRKKQYLELGH